MSATTPTTPTSDAYASTRQTASRALLENTTLDGAVAEILRAISNDLEWPLALYWIAGADRRGLRCGAIWVSETLKHAEIVEASRLAVVSAGANEDPAGRAYEGRASVWIEDLPGAATSAGSRLALA